MAKRRGNGEGSVYRRKDGRVVGEYVDANGRRRYVSGRTKTEVKAKLRKLLADRDRGVAYDSENLTVGAYLDRWLGAVKGTVRERTWERHEQVVRLHLGPTLGGTRLDRLNALQVQSLYGRRLPGRRRRRGPALRGRGRRHVRRRAGRGRGPPLLWGRPRHLLPARRLRPRGC